MGLERHIPDVLIDRLKGDVLLGYNSDSACFEISHAFLLIVLLKFLSFVTRGDGSWTVYGTGGYSFRCSFLTKKSQPYTVEINNVSLYRTIEVYRLRLGWNLNGTEFIIRSGGSGMVMGE